MSNSKLVFFDIDGTLLNDMKFVNHSTINAINELIKHDFIFCVATGRALADNLLEIAKISNINGFIVLANGNYVWDIKNETLTTLGLEIDKKVVNKFYEVCKKVKRQLNITFNDGTSKNYYFGEDINEIKDPKFYMFGPTIYNFSAIQDIEEELKKPILHISIKAEQEIIKEILPEFNEFQEQSLAQISNVSNIYIEAEAFGVSKWNGCQYVQKKLDISNENTYAFGDSENDEAILQNVGHAICMGNGQESTKAIAEKVIGDNNSDAIAEYLLSLIENE